jgi:glutamyl-tRNA(Gln) amidotransferase subunit E
MKVGLEIHQQLATGKLFCACPSELSDQIVETIVRRLRPTGGELSEIDPAAAYEASLGHTFRYEIASTSCLVEADEEPPHPLNPQALDVVLMIALLLHAAPLEEVEVMRKIVIDGSNTAGFQRTALVATDGWLELNGRRYSIPTICLEEDAARKIEEGHGEVRYRLDRLGIPLVEIATGPDLTSPEEVREVAGTLGALLRATGRVRRGIGTIREDLNLSVEGGSRVEIKGIQDLRLLPRYAEEEVRRQEHLLQIRRELQLRGAPEVPETVVDVSDLLAAVGHGPVARALRGGGVALAACLSAFAGLMGNPAEKGPRLGTELADHARAVGLGGILHSDELPNSAIGPELVDELRRRVSAGPQDGFILVASVDREKAREGLRRVLARARDARQGVPPETRDPLPDGTTRYSRPLPGRDRMYPETDVPPLPISPDHLTALRARLPELPSASRDRLVARYSLGDEQASFLVREGEVERFEELVGRGHAPGLVARLLVQELPSLRSRAGNESWTDPSAEVLGAVLTAEEAGRFAKEGLGPVLEAVVARGRTVDEAIHEAGVEAMSRDALEALIERVLDQNEAVIRSRGAGALSPLMGDVMREVRGRRDGKEVADRLRSALDRRLSREARPP